MAILKNYSINKLTNFSKISINFCGISAFFIGSIIAPYQAAAYNDHLSDQIKNIKPLINTSQKLSFLPLDTEKIITSKIKIISSGTIVTTAYSSTYWETDGDPWTTASGKKVFDGALAANFLPFGTQVTFPEIFGDKIFTVVDRMNARHHHKMDIWFPEYQQAKNFGVKNLAYNIVSE